MVIRVSTISRIVGVIEPRVPGINRTNGCSRVRGIAGRPYSINHEGVKTAVDGDADGIVMRNGVLAEVGAEVVSCGSAAGAIDPVMEPVGLILATGRRIIPGTVGNGMWVGSTVGGNIRVNVSSWSMAPRAAVRVEPV